MLVTVGERSLRVSVANIASFDLKEKKKVFGCVFLSELKILNPVADVIFSSMYNLK